MVAARHDVLGEEHRAEAEWIMHARPDSFASSILLAGESYYHKLDLEFCAADPSPEREGKDAQVAPACPSGVYMPAPGTPGHFLLGQLVSGLRYAKARKRGQHLTCWRFCSAIVDWLCSLLCEQSMGWQSLHRKLNTEEYLRLDSVLDPQVSARIRAALDLSSPDGTDMAVISLLDRMIELSSEKGDALGSPIPRGPMGRLSDFLRSELRGLT
jgi:hypothetical protein